MQEKTIPIRGLEIRAQVLAEIVWGVWGAFCLYEKRLRSPSPFGLHLVRQFGESLCFMHRNISCLHRMTWGLSQTCALRCRCTSKCGHFPGESMEPRKSPTRHRKDISVTECKCCSFVFILKWKYNYTKSNHHCVHMLPRYLGLWKQNFVFCFSFMNI